MVPSAHGLTPSPNALKTYCQTHWPNIEFEWLDTTPLIDSSLATLDTWQQLCSLILKYQNEYQQIILLHGTDTLAYSANALAFALHNTLTCQLLISGAQRSVFEDNNDAHANLAACLQSNITQMAGIEVLFAQQPIPAYSCYKADTQAAQAFAARDVENRIHHPYHHTHFAPLTLQTVILSPNAHYQLHADCQVLIILAYGSGTLTPDAITLIKQANAAHIAVIVSSQVKQGDLALQRYAVNQAQQPLRIFNGDRLSYEGIIAACHYFAAAQDDLMTALAFEFDEILL